jgi:protein SCO1
MEDRLSVASVPPGARREELFVLWASAFILVVTVFWWSFALWPVRDAPYWLARTRLVCFGVADNGLPDAAGWVGLIGQPLGMLAALLVGWRRDVRGAARLLLASGRGRAGGAAALGLLLLALAGLGWRVDAARGPAGWTALDEVPITYPRLHRAAPDLDLVDHTGAEFTLSSVHGRPAILTFAFAHCSTICPVLVRNALDAQAELAAAGRPEEVAVIVVTLDPWRDTPARLPHVARSWGLAGAAYLLGGEPERVEAVLDAWSVPRARDMRTGDVSHPALSYVLDADGRIAYASSGGVAALVELVNRL